MGGGVEKVVINFVDYTQVLDVAHNNTLANGTASSPLSSYQYLSPVAASAVDGAGSSIKYTLVSMFSF